MGSVAFNCVAFSATDPVVKAQGNAQVNKAVVDASYVLVRVVKDGHIPVKGTFNLGSGALTNTTADKSNLTIVLESTSWDSGLNKRDELIQKYILESDKEGNQNIVLSLDAPAFAGKATNTADTVGQDVNFTGKLFWAGKEIAVTTTCQVLFNAAGRLIIKSKNPLNLKFSTLGLTPALQTYIEMRQIESVSDDMEVSVYLELENTAVK